MSSTKYDFLVVVWISPLRTDLAARWPKKKPDQQPITISVSWQLTLTELTAYRRSDHLLPARMDNAAVQHAHIPSSLSAGIGFHFVANIRQATSYFLSD